MRQNKPTRKCVEEKKLLVLSFTVKTSRLVSVFRNRSGVSPVIVSGLADPIFFCLPLLPSMSDLSLNPAAAVADGRAVEDSNVSLPAEASASISDVDEQRNRPSLGSRGWRFVRQIYRGIGSGIEFLFNVFCLVVCLAALAAIPIVNLIPLGMLLAAEGNTARTGRLLPGLPLRHAAGQIGIHVIGALLFLLPLSYLGSFASDAVLIDPGSNTTRILRTVAAVAAVLTFFHLLLSMARGPRLRHFFSPWRNVRWGIARLKQGSLAIELGEGLRGFLVQLELKRHLKLGAVGAIGVLMWTFLPTFLFAVADSSRGGQVLITIFGGFCLAVVLCWVPILQAHYSAEEKFSAYRAVSHARQLFGRSPCLWTLCLLLGFALSLVLYLFKIAAPPRDAVFLLTPFFIATIYPARLAAGGVYAWSNNRTQKAWWPWRWFWNLACLATCMVYVFLLFFTRNIGAHGKLVLFEQPFLLIPSPF